METDFFSARDGTQGLTHEARTLPLNHTPIARLCFVFSGLQDRNLFEIMRYIDILFHLLFLFYASSQATHICKHSYGSTICLDNSYLGI